MSNLLKIQWTGVPILSLLSHINPNLAPIDLRNGYLPQTIYMNHLTIILLSILLLLAPSQLPAQITDQEPTIPADIATFFGPETPMDLEIILDMKQVFRKKQDEDYLPAIFTIKTAKGDISREVGVKARGEFRRGYCSAPPLKIQFKHANFGIEGWEHLRSLKLVTTCKNSESFQEYLAREYLTYRMYNAVTPMSFQVRMAYIIFKDKNNRYDPVEQMAFFIEDIDDLAERNDAFELEPPAMEISWADRNQTNLMTMFEFAIGNTDWHVGNLHNVKVIKTNDPAIGKTFLIPYDFDFAGLVNTHYALPNESLMIPDVRTRLFLGRCVTEAEMEVAIASMEEARPAWVREIMNCSWLNEQGKSDCLDYIDDFFWVAESEYRRKVAFFSNCPGN